MVWVVLGLAVTSAWGVRLTSAFIDRQLEDRALVAWVEATAEPSAQLLTFGPTLTFRHYSRVPTSDLFDAARGPARSAYVLIDVDNIERQWRGQPPSRAFERLRAERGLTPLGSLRAVHPVPPGATMNVGLVAPGFSAHPADWCIPALRDHARCLAERADVRVLALRYPYRAGRYRIDGAEVLALGGATRRAVGSLSLWQHALGVLRREHRARRFDVLHAFWATESGLLAALAGRLLRVPTLVSLAGGELVSLPAIGYGDQRRAWERLKVRASLRLASAVSAGSVLLHRTARAFVPDPERLYRLPLGVDPSVLAGSARA